MAKKRDEHTADEEENEENDTAEPEAVEHTEMEAYVEALHRFSHLVDELDWPDHMDLANDKELCVRMFRDFRRERSKRKSDGSKYIRTHRFSAGKFSEEAFRKFIHHRFRHMEEEDEEEVHIDPKEHQPDEEHTNEEAKNRKKRFQDEWE
jgi:hypothetical protein